MAHIDNTAPEIWEQTAGEMDVFIMCQGTGGTVTGTAKYLKEKNPAIKVYVSEPEDSLFWPAGVSGSIRFRA